MLLAKKLVIVGGLYVKERRDRGSNEGWPGSRPLLSKLIRLFTRNLFNGVQEYRRILINRNSFKKEKI